MPARRDPAIARPLIAVFERAERRIAAELRRAIDRGLDYTAEQRRSQLASLRALLAETKRQGSAQAVAAIQTSYLTGALTGSLAAPNISLRGLAGVHRDAMAVLASNLDAHVRGSVDFVGRHVDDAFRVAAVHEVATGIAAGQGRRTVSAALKRRLVDRAVTNAVTGFIDRGGRRWSLSAYTRMVARTTTREAVTRGTVNRLAELEFDLVTISSHGDPCPICEPYDGETFSLSGRDPAYPLLDEEPPFHPNAVPAGTQIASLGKLRGAVRAEWDGPLVDVASAGGIRLAIGPNHPVLTARGWLAAKLLREGDHILRRVGRHGAWSSSVEEDLDDGEAAAEDLFDALASVGSRATVPASGDDLHGDGRFCQGEVDVVRTDCLLGDEADPGLAQEGGEDELMRADTDDPPLARGGTLLAHRERVRPAIGRSLPQLKAALLEAAAQSGAAKPATFGEALTRFPGAVATDQIVEVGYRDRWRGQAFDFETTTGSYFAGGLYVSNCLHVLTPAAENLDRQGIEAGLSGALAV